jgi:hypothetical protein
VDGLGVYEGDLEAAVDEAVRKLHQRGHVTLRRERQDQDT